MQTMSQEKPEPLFTLKYLYNTANPLQRDVGVLLQEEWGKIGVNLVLEGYETATVRSRIWGKSGFPTFPTHDEGGFDVYLQSYNWIPTDLVYYLGCFTAEGIPPLGWNYWAAHDSRADMYLRKCMSTYNMTERKEWIYKWQEQKQEEVNEIVIAWPMRAYFTKANIKNYCIRLNCYDIDLWTVEGKTEEDHVTVRYAMSEDPTVLLPMFGDGGYLSYLPIHRCLFRLVYDFEKETFSLEPELVKDYELSEDGMSMILHLRDDVKFHDGVPMTSADVKWTFDAILDPATGSTYYGDLSAVIKSVEAPDDYTVIFHFNKPSPEILTLLAPPGGYCAILPKHVLGNIPHDQLRTCKYNTEEPPPGLGPMKFVEWKKGEYVKFEANDDYFKGRPFIDEFIQVIIPEATTALAALEAGDVDILHTGYSTELAGEIERLKKERPDINVNLAPFPATWFIALNNDHPVLNNKYVRQALAYATPYDKIINDLMMGLAEHANSQIHKSSWAWNPNAKYYTYDLDKARECLRKAGYPEWPPPQPAETPAPTGPSLMPTLGGFIGGIIIGIVLTYVLVRRR